jgi:cell division topological specificity factor
MSGLFERLFGRNSGTQKPSTPSGSGKLAKDRLQMVLVQDRLNLPSDKMEAMKREIIEVISKYVSVDLDKVDFALANRERNGLLIAEIPFRTEGDPTRELDETPPSRAAAANPAALIVSDPPANEARPPIPAPNPLDELPTAAPTNNEDITP